MKKGGSDHDSRAPRPDGAPAFSDRKAANTPAHHHHPMTATTPAPEQGKQIRPYLSGLPE